MKILFLSLLISILSFAGNFSEFEIQKGRLHKGGFMEASTDRLVTDNQISVSVKYEVDPVWWLALPVVEKYLVGTYIQKLPAKLLSEEGMLNLEKVKTINIFNARGKVEAVVQHQGRISYNQVRAHRIRIEPTNKKSEMYVTYHSSIDGLGWDDLKLIIHTPIPLLKSYVIEGKAK